MLGDHDDFHRDYSNPLPRTDQRTSPIAATCGHADCAESPELARACTLAERFAMPDPDGISWAGERAYRAIMAVFTQLAIRTRAPWRNGRATGAARSHAGRARGRELLLRRPRGLRRDLHASLTQERTD